MKRELDLRGRVAVVTGAARGIGREIGETFATHGARVVVSDVLPEEGTRAASEIGGGSFFVSCDVSDETQARALIDAAVDGAGRVDILVNNAAYNPMRAEERMPVDEYSEQVFRRTQDVDICGTFYCTKYAARRMIAQGDGGSIINIASIAGMVPLRRQIGHVVGKAAVVRMTEASALELGVHGIRVNAISPGSTVTAATRALFYGEDAAYNENARRLLSFVPLGRPGQPRDIADAALFLASDLAGYVTGQNLAVDGGWTCGYARDF